MVKLGIQEFVRFNSSEEIPNFTNYDISESNMRCDICIKELWNDMSHLILLSDTS